MSERHAGPITEELLTTVHSLTLPMIVESLWSSYAVQARFDAAVADMEVGEIKEIHLMPEEAYGMPNPNAILTLEIANLPGSEDLEVGQKVYLTNQSGQPFPVTVTAKDEKMITLDANHEMAGKELNFKIELVEVK